MEKGEYTGGRRHERQPVYLNGKLAGALASASGFSKEPIAE